jgi:hypothetical protein
MYSEPAAWHRLLEKLSQVVGEYLLAQARAGAQALQLFDSWVGQLSPADYREYVLPHSRAALEIAAQAGVPIIHFGTDTGGMLPLIRQAGGDVIGVDWRIDLAEAWRTLGPDVAVQGNLGTLTHGLIESQYNGAVKGALILGVILVLMPVIEWGVYLFVMRRRIAAPAAPEEPIVRFEPPSDTSANG